jgi:uncharacterized protein (DUF1499 family)
MNEPKQTVGENGNHPPRHFRWLRKILILALVGVSGMYFLNFSAKRPANLGVKNGRFAPLAEMPNGVSTQSSKPDQQMDPIPFTGSNSKEMQRIVAAVTSMPGSKIVEQDSHYLRAEFTSRIFRFVDDVEFFIDDKEKVIQFRSASRIGYSDMGVNRRRMNLLCEKINQ